MTTQAEEMRAGLEPCPFCGKAPVTQDYRSWSDETGEVEGYAAVECRCLGHNGGLFFHFDTLEEAIAAWNRRAPNPLSAHIAELETRLAGAEEAGRLKGLEEAAGFLAAEAKALNAAGADYEAKEWFESADQARTAAAHLNNAAEHLRSLTQQEPPPDPRIGKEGGGE